MKLRSLITTTALASVMTLASNATADSILDYVPRDSEFVAQLNISEVLNSDAFEYVWTEVIHGEQFEQQIEAFQNLTEVDLRNDIHRIAISGRVDEDESVVIVVEGNLPMKKLTSLAQFSQTYKKHEYNGLAVHEWNEGGSKYVIELSPTRLMFSNTAARYIESLEAAKQAGKSASITKDMNLPGDVDNATAWAYLSATGDRELSEINRIFGVSGGLMTLNITGEDIDAKATFQVADGDADRWESLANGMISLVQLQREEPRLGELASRILVETDDKTDRVMLSLGMAVDEIVETAEVLESLDR